MIVMGEERSEAKEERGEEEMRGEERGEEDRGVIRHMSGRSLTPPGGRRLQKLKSKTAFMTSNYMRK